MLVLVLYASLFYVCLMYVSVVMRVSFLCVFLMRIFVRVCLFLIRAWVFNAHLILFCSGVCPGLAGTFLWFWGTRRSLSRGRRWATSRCSRWRTLSAWRSSAQPQLLPPVSGVVWFCSFCSEMPAFLPGISPSFWGLLMPSRPPFYSVSCRSLSWRWHLAQPWLPGRLSPDLLLGLQRPETPRSSAETRLLFPDKNPPGVWGRSARRVSLSPAVSVSFNCTCMSLALVSSMETWAYYSLNLLLWKKKNQTG